jgi:uncharacterized protein
MIARVARIVVVCLILGGCAAPSVVEQDSYDGFVTYLRNGAEQGDPAAQTGLGNLYFLGLHVSQDYAEAVKWYRKAADQGDAEGQYWLGTMYELGLGVPMDPVQAHLWFSLASDRGDHEAAESRDYVVARMTSDQIAEAQKLAREWKPKQP